ncbi:abortive infection system antitoxin AbiGi family protein [Belliella marina]|uniref:Abortive infection system antitoxin AbiGi family protein n=1 Tax=Belliella marina TaxID=1644146 RepID=A0ABW4VH84_9BACT
MARISSSTLFNFTDSIDYLVNNLKDGFYCHNTYEKLPLRNNGYRVPMACFCDIPLSLIKEHFDWYGRYGIGIKRTYARKQGVKPVWYVTSESNLVRNLVKQESLSEYERKHLLPYLKQFLGNQAYQSGKEKRKKFYDEREWRYIPDNSLVEFFFGLKAQREKRTAMQNGERMKLDLNQVEYIIIEKESDFDKMINEIRKITNGNKELKFENLIAKIMTAKQIERDF